jgi:Mg2+ and Co2+ transporter CorA
MKWTDITNPTESYIKNLNEQFKLPEGCLQSFLKANAQPTYQVIGFCKILVLRAVEDQLKNNADSIHDLTRKIVIIETTHNQGQELWTLHHRPITWLESYYSTQPSDLIVQTLLQKTLQTFQTILDQDQKFLFDYQNHVFSIKKTKQ